MKKDASLYNLRTVINSGTLRPYFSRLGQPLLSKNRYTNTYDFSEYGLVKAKFESNVPMIHKSTIEKMFLRGIRTYIENDLHAIRLSLKTISVTPIRIELYNNDMVPIQQYILEGFRGILCINRENIRGGIIEAGNFKRELIPLEMVLAPSITISPVHISDSYIQESYVDMLLFHLK